MLAEELYNKHHDDELMLVLMDLDEMMSTQDRMDLYLLLYESLLEDYNSHLEIDYCLHLHYDEHFFIKNNNF